MCCSIDCFSKMLLSKVQNSTRGCVSKQVPFKPYQSSPKHQSTVKKDCKSHKNSKFSKKYLEDEQKKSQTAYQVKNLIHIIRISQQEVDSDDEKMMTFTYENKTRPSKCQLFAFWMM